MNAFKRIWLIAAAGTAATALVALARRLRRPGEPTDTDGSQGSALVDEAGRESFPASDPPGWTLGADRAP